MSKRCRDLQAFINNPENITWLNLLNKDITDADCKKLAAAFPKANKLIYLNLNSNQIRDKGAIEIAKGIKSLKKLEHLGLEDSQIGDEGAMAIADAFKGLDNIKKLAIGSNVITENTLKDIKSKLGDKLYRKTTQRDHEEVINKINEKSNSNFTRKDMNYEKAAKLLQLSHLSHQQVINKLNDKLNLNLTTEDLNYISATKLLQASNPSHLSHLRHQQVIDKLNDKLNSNFTIKDLSYELAVKLLRKPLKINQNDNIEPESDDKKEDDNLIAEFNKDPSTEKLKSLITSTKNIDYNKISFSMLDEVINNANLPTTKLVKQNIKVIIKYMLTSFNVKAEDLSDLLMFMESLRNNQYMEILELIKNEFNSKAISILTEAAKKHEYNDLVEFLELGHSNNELDEAQKRANILKQENESLKQKVQDVQKQKDESNASKDKEIKELQQQHNIILFQAKLKYQQEMEQLKLEYESKLAEEKAKNEQHAEQNEQVNELVQQNQQLKAIQQQHTNILLQAKLKYMEKIDNLKDKINNLQEKIISNQQHQLQNQQQEQPNPNEEVNMLLEGGANDEEYKDEDVNVSGDVHVTSGEY